MVQLVKIVFPREDWSVGQHLRQDAADCPHVDGLVVPLGVDHDLRSSVPAGGHVLRQEARVIVLGISDTCEAKVANLEVTRGVQ